ncbi:MAG: hypothetical protein GYB68_08670 [Chloroflexi bacterium]|nr:hypothetical protein [Chloroflexota bacterium]
MAVESQEPKVTRANLESAQVSTVVAGVVIAVASWSGLVWLVTNRYPTVEVRWAFFALLYLGVTGTALPFVRFLNQRFGQQGGLFVPPGVLIRQANWVGVFVAASAWLRIPRLLSGGLIVVLLVALIAIEALLRLRERMRDPLE